MALTPTSGWSSILTSTFFLASHCALINAVVFVYSSVSWAVFNAKLCCLFRAQVLTLSFPYDHFAMMIQVRAVQAASPGLFDGAGGNPRPGAPRRPHRNIGGKWIVKLDFAINLLSKIGLLLKDEKPVGLIYSDFSTFLLVPLVLFFALSLFPSLLSIRASPTGQATTILTSRRSRT